MKKIQKLMLISLFAACHPLSAITKEKEYLDKMYTHHSTNRSDINEHLPVLYKLAKECSSVTEIGIRSMVSTWAVLKGLSENELIDKIYVGIDLNYPPKKTLEVARKLSEVNGINFTFVRGNDMQIDIEPVDMLFIDSLHTYCHLIYELEKFSPKVKKYITLHDTSAPWGDIDDSEYHGDYSEYPQHINRTKRGLWPAVEDFLKSHPEWKLHERRVNNHGFTILKRIK
jgi:hypothetical protein